MILNFNVYLFVAAVTKVIKIERIAKQAQQVWLCKIVLIWFDIKADFI